MTPQHDGIDLDDLWQAIEVCYEKNWTDGIDLSADPILLARSAAYSISYERRHRGDERRSP